MLFRACEGRQGGRGGAERSGAERSAPRQVRKANCVLGKVVLRNEVAWLREKRVKDSQVPPEYTYGNYLLGEERMEIHATATWSCMMRANLGEFAYLFGANGCHKAYQEVRTPGCLCIVCLPFVPHRPWVGSHHRELGSLVGKLLQEGVWETALEWCWAILRHFLVMSADPFGRAGVRGMTVVTGSILTTIFV